MAEPPAEVPPLPEAARRSFAQRAAAHGHHAARAAVQRVPGERHGHERAVHAHHGADARGPAPGRPASAPGECGIQTRITRRRRWARSWRAWGACPAARRGYRPGWPGPYRSRRSAARRRGPPRTWRWGCRTRTARRRSRGRSRRTRRRGSGSSSTTCGLQSSGYGDAILGRGAAFGRNIGTGGTARRGGDLRGRQRVAGGRRTPRGGRGDEGHVMFEFSYAPRTEPMYFP